MSKELSKGLRIYDILSNNDFGILLKNEADCNNPAQPFDNDVSLSDLADILYRMETEKEKRNWSYCYHQVWSRPVSDA